jgi:hypothetical protein
LSTFEYLSVALSFVIGLAVTYLLISLLSLFRERRTCRPDWLALLWAGYVFTYQVQFWWALFEASAMHNWTLPQFFGLLAFSLLLFGAGGLVIPHDAARHPEGLRAYFEVATYDEDIGQNGWLSASEQDLFLEWLGPFVRTSLRPW